MTKPRIHARRVNKPILALASPSSDRPEATIEKLKDGSLNWKVRVPASSIKQARLRAVAEARLLMADVAKLEEEWTTARAGRLAAKLTESGK